MNIEIPFNLEMSGTASASYTSKNVRDRLLVLKGMKNQSEEVKREIEFLEGIRQDEARS